MALALNNDLNLYAYHLPLDAHPQLGNNAQLARVGLAPSLRDDGAPHLWPGQSRLAGRRPGLATLGDLAARVRERLGREPLLVGDPSQPLGRVAWCTGGAQGMLADAVDAGATAYITGEVSESTVHLARRPAWASSARATMPPNATASRRWDRPWPNASASRSSSWTSTTPSDRPDASAPRRQPKMRRENARKGRFLSGHVWVKAPGNARDAGVMLISSTDRGFHAAGPRLPAWRRRGLPRTWRAPCRWP